jgi:hypothetical protein
MKIKIAKKGGHLMSLMKLRCTGKLIPRAPRSDVAPRQEARRPVFYARKSAPLAIEKV